MKLPAHLACRLGRLLTSSTLLFVWIWLACRSTCLYADLEYKLTRLDSGSVEVQLDFTASNVSKTTLTLERDWGGIKNDGTDVAELRVSNESGTSCTVRRDGDVRWDVEHEPAGRLTARYVIHPQAHRAPHRGNDYRTVVRPDLFHTILHLSLLHPDPQGISDSQNVSIRIAFSGFEQSDSKIMSSFGEGEGPFDYRGGLDQFLHATILAGKIESRSRTVEGNTIAVAMEPAEWSFSVDQLADAVEKVVRIHRGFFSDHSDRWFLVTLSKRPVEGPGSLSLGGTALSNAFSMYCTPNLSLNPASPESNRAYWLLAHEYFHNWNGIKIPSAGEDPQTYWFSEGFTNFFTRRLMHRAGLINDQGFADDLNRALGMFDKNPKHAAPNSEIADGFWSDRNAQELPYQRGDLAALWLDEQIRAHSSGAKNMDDFLIDMFRNPSDEKTLTCESLLKRIEGWISADAAAQLRAAIIEGKELPLPEELSTPALKLRKGMSQSFDPNFNTDATRTTGVITGLLEDGPAFKAGLRNGQKLRRFDVRTASPDQAPSAEVVIIEEGKEKTIKYEAVGKPAPVRMYQALKK